ncbi:MAG: hypothetical protein ACR2HZ_08960 [Gemmatimonadaceae bacterium]
MIEYLALAVVVIVALYFVALGTSALLAPAFAKRFFLGFASSPLAHYTELLTRFIVGVAFLAQSPRMLFSAGFNIFGWILIVTTAGLLLVPWQWHHRFAQQAVPQAMRHIILIGLCSLVLGGFVLVAVVRGASA